MPLSYNRVLLYVNSVVLYPALIDNWAKLKCGLGKCGNEVRNKSAEMKTWIEVRRPIRNEPN